MSAVGESLLAIEVTMNNVTEFVHVKATVEDVNRTVLEIAEIGDKVLVGTQLIKLGDDASIDKTQRDSAIPKGTFCGTVLACY